MAPLAETIFITGANRGIGLEIVKQLFRNATERPKHLFATCRNVANADELQELAKEFGSLHVIPIKDVKDYASYPEIVKKVDEVVGENGLNLLINNAGIVTRDSSLTEVTRDQMMEVYEVNTVCPLLLTQAFVPLLKRASQKFASSGVSCSRAAVISVTSQMGSIGSMDSTKIGSFYPYRASKAALNMVSKSLCNDLKDDNILVNVIHPGWVQTDMGGPKAPMLVSESAAAILRTLASLTQQNNGQFLNHDGTTLPW